jgi:xanthine phosphoribosyltransferase
MELLKQKIRSEGRVIGTDILKVDSFLNHQIDTEFMQLVGQEFASLFADQGITKIITIESSGIAPALFTGLSLGVPVIYAKKSSASNMDPDTYQASVHSFTRGGEYMIRISRKYLKSVDTVLFVDDFLAHGQALLGLLDMAGQAGARVAGAGIVIEKGFQNGGSLVRNMGIRVESLAIIQEMSEEGSVIVFSDEKNDAHTGGGKS